MKAINLNIVAINIEDQSWMHLGGSIDEMQLFLQELLLELSHIISVFGVVDH